MIQLSGAALAYRRPPGNAGLAEVSLRLAPGAFRWVLGPPGAGKSSLLRLLDTSRRATAGRALVLGTDPARASAGRLARLRRRIGSVPETPTLLPGLTAFENVALPLRVDGVRAAAARIDAIEMLQWVGLGARMEADAAALSRGERQLCAIARAVIRHPELLVADEPFAGLEPATAGRLLALFRELARLGAIVLVATSDEAFASRHSAPALRLAGGRLATEEHAA